MLVSLVDARSHPSHSAQLVAGVAQKAITHATLRRLQTMVMQCQYDVQYNVILLIAPLPDWQG
jgi:hypothetical protein